MCGKSNIEIYITICKMDGQWEFAVWLRKLKQGLCINVEGWDGAGQSQGPDPRLCCRDGAGQGRAEQLGKELLSIILLSISCLKIDVNN